jgi:hypothetical protein
MNYFLRRGVAFFEGVIVSMEKSTVEYACKGLKRKKQTRIGKWQEMASHYLARVVLYYIPLSAVCNSSYWVYITREVDTDSAPHPTTLGFVPQATHQQHRSSGVDRISRRSNL